MQPSMSRQQQLTGQTIKVTSALHAAFRPLLLFYLLLVFHACITTFVSGDREYSKGRYAIHSLQFVGHQADYYETDTRDALQSFSFGGPLRGRRGESKILLPYINNWKHSKRQIFGTHTLQFIGYQASYYETNARDALQGFPFSGAIKCRQAKRVKKFRADNLLQAYVTHGWCYEVCEAFKAFAWWAH